MKDGTQIPVIVSKSTAALDSVFTLVLIQLTLQVAMFA